MPVTYESIATVSPTNAAGTFTSIPQTYTDLIVVVKARVTSAWDIFAMQANGAGSGYSGTYIESTGNSGGYTAGRGTSEISFRGGYIPGTSYTNDWSTDVYHISNYSDSTKWKNSLANARFQSGVGGTTASFSIQLKIGMIQSTTAITSLVYGTANGSNFASGTTISLYGIKAA
jgi:hypothetical protein